MFSRKILLKFSFQLGVCLPSLVCVIVVCRWYKNILWNTKCNLCLNDIS